MDLLSNFKLEKNKDKMLQYNATITENLSNLFLSDKPYANFLYIILDNDECIYLKSNILESNTNSACGQMYMCAGAVLDMDTRLNIVAFGFCADQSFEYVFNRIDLEDPLIKERADAITIAGSVILNANGEGAFCAGENMLVKAFLGLIPMGKNWAIALGDNTDADQCLYRIEQKNVAFANVKQGALKNSIFFEATIQNSEVLELILCNGKSPVFRKLVHKLVNVNLPQDSVTNGVIAIQNYKDSEINIGINGSNFVFYEYLRYDYAVQNVHDDIAMFDLEGNYQLFSCPQSMYLGAKNESQIKLFAKSSSGQLNCLLTIVNENFIVDVSSNGCLFLYADNTFTIYHKSNGVWSKTKYSIPDVQDFAVVMDYSNGVVVVCIQEQSAVVFNYNIEQNFLQRGQTYSDCTRLFRQDAHTVFVSDEQCDVFYALRGDGFHAEMGNAIKNAIGDKQLFHNYFGLFLYNQGSQYNTINRLEVKNTNFDNCTVFLCGCFVVTQNKATNDMQVFLYNRFDDTFESVFKREYAVDIVSVGQLDNYIVILDSEGKLDIYEHKNRYAYLLKFDLKITDIITTGFIVQSKTGFDGSENFKTKFEFEFS